MKSWTSNRLFLKLNQFICNCVAVDRFSPSIEVATQDMNWVRPLEHMSWSFELFLLTQRIFHRFPLNCGWFSWSLEPQTGYLFLKLNQFICNYVAVGSVLPLEHMLWSFGLFFINATYTP